MLWGTLQLLTARLRPVRDDEYALPPRIVIEMCTNLYFETWEPCFHVPAACS